MTTPHPYAAILHAIADGKKIQWQDKNGFWLDNGAVVTLYEISTVDFPPDRYRVKPASATIFIGEHEVPEPLRVMPQVGVQVFWPSFNTIYGVCAGAGSFSEPMEETLLNMGLLHLTADAAEQHAKALVSLTAAKS